MLSQSRTVVKRGLMFFDVGTVDKLMQGPSQNGLARRSLSRNYCNLYHDRFVRFGRVQVQSSPGEKVELSIEVVDL